MKNKIALFLTFVSLLFPFAVYAGNNPAVDSLVKQVKEAGTRENAYLALEDLTDLFFKENDYNGLVDTLKSIKIGEKDFEPVIDYYVALARYYQLKYLEEAQDWDEYFSKGNDYRQEISDNLSRSIASLDKKDPLKIYAQIILWKFHKDQEDNFADSALSGLMELVPEYSEGALNLAPIKSAADELLSYGEKAKSRQLYKIYTDKIVSSNLKNEELNRIAETAYREGNLYLSESIYDAFIERLKLEDKTGANARVVLEIARNFTFDAGDKKDPAYAEKVFKAAQSLAGKEIFDEGLMYLRALNLERSGDYKECAVLYKEIADKFPLGSHFNEAVFKAGVISAYVLSDVESAKKYFERVVLKGDADNYGASSLYQLGLLNQWEGNFDKAKEYYKKLIGKVEGGSKENHSLALKRLEEIEKGGGIEYNLKAFMDASIKHDYQAVPVDISILPADAATGSDISVKSSLYIGETGCLQVEMEYFWSGNTGTASPSKNDPMFSTQYSEPGTKVLGVVVVSPTGVVGSGLGLLDVK